MSTISDTTVVHTSAELARWTGLAGRVRTLLRGPRMAKSAYILLVGLGLAAGCQDAGTGVLSMPEPNFSAPVITHQQPTQAPVAVRPMQPSPVSPVKPKPPVVVSAGTPREWIPNAPARPWRYIVIHHSDTPDGNAAKFDAAHRAKGWDELG